MSKKKKKKVRVAFRKNRQKRARHSNLAWRAFGEETESVDLDKTERLTGKGELSRHRTIIGIEAEDEDGRQWLIDVDESKCLKGRVISAGGLNTTVQTDEGHSYECTVRRVVRTMARDERNAVVAGDIVLFQPVDDEYGVIERVNARHGTISRSSHGREHVIVANVDQVLIVASADQPPLKTKLIDRFLISSEKGEVTSLICINKVDLVDPIELQPVVGLYSRLGYDVVLTSARESLGIARLGSLLKGRETVLTGQSGVGKSALLNALQPDLHLKTKDVSEGSHKGRHTTRRTVLMPLDSGGWVIDTPGIRQLKLWDVISEEVEGYFIEFRPFVTRCKYPDCSHIHEEGCGVMQGVQRDQISSARYESYLRIVSGDLR